MASPEPKRDLVDGDDLEKSISLYKDVVVTGVHDVPDQAALVTANISGMKLSPEENKRLVRKIDCWLMPLLCLVYMIQFVGSNVSPEHPSPTEGPSPLRRRFLLGVRLADLSFPLPFPLSFRVL